MNGYPKTALIFASLTLAFSQAASAAAPPNAKMWNGAWHLNAAKSKFASPAKEQSETRTYTVSGSKIAMKSSSKDMSGKTMNFSYSAAWDGAPHRRVIARRTAGAEIAAPRSGDSSARASQGMAATPPASIRAIDR